ncbi:MAG: DUF4974 domain-containing protein [Prolixibacteraceae bacterium]|mgnify:CR=1 FL=1|jgi:transmembrane sensor|nr:DUF4974 domain-containing protein [Prolixibacteraceae bacterium]MBT6005840.1 DUF4974 domain-containing protein [Prolixibacteraceae bacterium]MBT6767235.1 DUF4974 domain-containing protein [Prolixibacteraceae bacterium]MBT6998795.1 DUF4974 domain-containing protein [Prolixibacteraceae bacterium]MBT7394953.1 DUF4974 domain-containing protein [Prolixibacteraceae bacterium]
MKNDSENIKITPEEFNKMNSEEKIMKMAGAFIPPSGTSKSDALNIVLKRTDKINHSRIINLKRIIQIAATVIFVIGTYAIINGLSKDRITTNFAEQKEINLPDGSEVRLNAISKIIWSRKHFAKKRLIALQGEAFFNVEKGTPFTITTKNGTVDILGTQLNVFSRENEFWVSCISGKVRVNTGQQQHILLPGEMAELTPNGLIKLAKNNIEKTAYWKQGIFYFEDKPLVSIFEAVERQFDLKVEHKNLGDRLMTVSFSNENLKESLDVICIPMGLSYEIKNNKKIVVKEKK